LYLGRLTLSFVFTFRDEYTDSVSLLEKPQCEINIIIRLYLFVLLQTYLKCVCIYTHASHRNVWIETTVSQEFSVQCT